MNNEFVSFPKMEQVGKLYMTITQKLHGTNAQILITQVERPDDRLVYDVLAGARSRWLTPDDDNHGFCRWVMENRDELVEKLGSGRHYGEWCGKGINTGEGLPEKRLYLFNWRRYHEMPLPDKVATVPVLYAGKFSFEKIDEVMLELKTTGSRIVEGYMKPEGIVIEVDGRRYKKVFDPEDTRWDRPEKTRTERLDAFDPSPFLHPIRLEKLLSRDEKYVREYPDSLPDIVRAYIQDLNDEKQIPGDEEEIALKRKLMSRGVFNFVKNHFMVNNI